MTAYSPPAIAMVVAMDCNRVIGADGSMPWHIPGDLRWFKQQTIDKPIVMGRRTFESIGRALPRRRNLVMTRQPDALKNQPGASDIEIVADLEAAIAAAAGVPELMVIGGAQIYALALPRATRLIVTRIEHAYTGDTFFPEVEWADWLLVDERRVAADGDTPAHRFMTWHRKAG